ncbi:MAG: biotin/lipoyl-containing protein [Acidobacteriota bacterium]
MEYEFLFEEKDCKIKHLKRGNESVFQINDKSYSVQYDLISENFLLLKIENKIYKVYFAENEDIRYINVNGEFFILRQKEKGLKKLPKEEKLAEDQTICAPMPGNIVKINVKEGETVEKNQSLIILEAMKMENILVSPIKGKVERIYVSSSQLVNANQPLLEIKSFS